MEKCELLANLDQNGSVELAHSNARADPLPGGRQQHIEDLVVGLPLPDVLHRLPQVLVRLVQPALHLDVERGADESEQGRLELDGAVVVQRHVHRDESFASNSRGTEAAEAQGWVDLSEEGEDVHVLDPTLAIGVVLCPGRDKLIKMMRTKYRPVPGVTDDNKFEKTVYQLPVLESSKCKLGLPGFLSFWLARTW